MQLSADVSRAFSDVEYGFMSWSVSFKLFHCVCGMDARGLGMGAAFRDEELQCVVMVRYSGTWGCHRSRSQRQLVDKQPSCCADKGS